MRASGSIDNSSQDASNRVNLEDIPLFKFDELMNATNSFSEANKLGKGGFGTVYMVSMNVSCLFISFALILCIVLVECTEHFATPGSSG